MEAVRLAASFPPRSKGFFLSHVFVVGPCRPIVVIQEILSKISTLKHLPFCCIIQLHNAPMEYGYARVSTDGQSVDAQVRQLTKAGCKKVFREVASGAKTDRA
jgi:hypothetical protein